MNARQSIAAKLDDTENKGQCLYTSDHNSQQELRRLTESGQVIRVRKGLYIRQTTWKQLTGQEQYLWLLRGLHRQHPKWTFTAISAISVYHIEYPSWLINDRGVFLATDKPMGVTPHSNLHYIMMNETERYSGNDRAVTSVNRALADCAVRYEFHEMLPMVDSALRSHLATTSGLLREAEAVRSAGLAIDTLLKYADAKSENGGESICRGILIEEGFTSPELQHEFVIPQKGKRYRIDAMYRLQTGKNIVIEFDGTDKYVNPSMTNKKTIRRVVHDERQREQDLMNYGHVDQIIRIDFKEVMQRTPLVKKLISAGVPRTDSFRAYHPRV